MEQNPDFYSTAAGVIPFLLVATVFEERLRPKEDPLSLYGFLAFLAAILFVVGEALALSSLADRNYTDTRETIIGAVLIVGLALVVIAVFPPRGPRSRPRKRWLAGLDENQRERIGGGIRLALALCMLIALSLLLRFNP